MKLPLGAGSFWPCEYCGEKPLNGCDCDDSKIVECCDCGKELPRNKAIPSAVFDDMYFCKDCARGNP